MIGTSALLALMAVATGFGVRCPEPNGTDSDPPGRAAIGSWGIDLRSLSRTVKPGDDFYTYVNEGWMKSARIPPGSIEIGAFTEVFLSTECRVETLIQDAVKSGPPK